LDMSVGMVRLDYKSSDPLIFEVSILLDPIHQKKGVAKQTLLALRRLVPFGVFIAFIQAENTASRHLFLSVGYRPTKTDDYYYLAPIYPHNQTDLLESASMEIINMLSVYG
jgi:RimJ/RimL family protein N-acetyltransferase